MGLGVLVAAILILAFLAAAFRVIPEYQRGVVFFLGRFHTVYGPGLKIIIPVIQQLVRVDLRTIVMDVPSQDVISRDNVTVKVNAVLYMRVTDPERAVIVIEDYLYATSQLAQTTLRSVLGEVELDELLKTSDVISLHLPLTPESRYLLNEDSLARIKPGAYLVNTSRGKLVDSAAVIRALKTGHLGGVALDVYEEEEGVFFEDHSDAALQDDVLSRLLTFPNVLITSHQAFLTHEALTAIASTTLDSIRRFAEGLPAVDERVVV